MSKGEPKKFNRGIFDKKILERARAFFQSPLGKKILEENSGDVNPFQICLRYNYGENTNYFNIYWNGCSVLKCTLRVLTNNNYIIDNKYVHGKKGDLSLYPVPREKTQLHNLTDLITETREDWSFYRDVIKQPERVFEEYVNRSDGKSKKEKTLLKQYLDEVEDSFLIDLEVAAPRNIIGRLIDIDMAEIVYDEKMTPVLRLVEVKPSDVDDLRARDRETLMTHPDKIMRQMERYQEFLDKEKDNVRDSYRLVADNMLDLGLDKYMKGMAGRSATEILEDFKERGVVDPKLHLLVLYSERDKTFEERHLERLREEIEQKYAPLRYVRVKG